MLECRIYFFIQAFFSDVPVQELFGAVGGGYGSEYRTVYLLTPYRASINNLSSPVEKTAEKTMKITYTLTQEASA